MGGININGQVKYPTGTYGEIFIVSDQSANIPEFNVGVIVGAQREGEGYDVNSGVTDPTLKKPVFYGFSQQSSLQDKFGKGSELDIAFGYAKRHGLPACFVAGISPTTQGAVDLDDTNSDPTITVTSKRYGTIARAYFIELITGVKIVITPPKNVCYLSADAAQSATEYKVKDIKGLKVGDTVFLAANTILPTPSGTITISTITPYKENGVIKYYTIKVSATLNSGGDADVAENAFIFSSDTTKQWTSAVLTSKTQIIAMTDEQDYAIFSDADDTLATLPIVVAEAPLAAAGNGKTPAPVADDWTTFLTNLPSLMNEFAFANKSELRVFLFLTGDNTYHIAFRDFAITRRTEDKPILAIAGTGASSVDIDSAVLAENPTLQAASLNNDDFILCVGGADGYNGYLSFAPAVFGRIIGNPVAHNLTNDSLLFVNPEVLWDESLGQITKLLKFSCLVYDNDPFLGLHIEKGVNTYQDNEETWNATDKNSYLVMQRSLADYFHYIRKRLSNTVGTTELEYSAADVKAREFAVATQAQKTGIIKSFGKIEVEPDPSKEGFIAKIEVVLYRENNYENKRTVILV